MSYSQLHMILENNIIYETKSYKLAKLNEQIYIKIKTGEQTYYTNGIKVLDNKFTSWMSIPYAKTQVMWFSDSLKAKILQGVRKSEKFITHKNI